MSSTDNVTPALNAIKRRYRYSLKLTEAAPLLARELKGITLNKPVEYEIWAAHKKMEELLIERAGDGHETLTEWCFAPVNKTHTKN